MLLSQHLTPSFRLLPCESFVAHRALLSGHTGRSGDGVEWTKKSVVSRKVLPIQKKKFCALPGFALFLSIKLLVSLFVIDPDWTLLLILRFGS